MPSFKNPDSSYRIAEEELKAEGVIPTIPNQDPRAIFDISNPRSVINLVPPQIKKAMLRVPLEFYEMDEEELVPLAFPKLQPGKLKPKPTPIDCRLRTAFWIEYERCQTLLTPMLWRNIYSGACTPSYFDQHWLSQKYKVAWLLKPPADYRLALEELLTYGLEEMRELMAIPLQDDAGRVNVKLAEVKFKIWQAVEMRLKGAVIQRVRSENLNVNVNTDHQGGVTPSSNIEEDVSTLDLRIAELEKGLHQALPPAIQQAAVLAPEAMPEMVELNKSKS